MSAHHSESYCNSMQTLVYFIENLVAGCAFIFSGFVFFSCSQCPQIRFSRPSCVPDPYIIVVFQCSGPFL